MKIYTKAGDRGISTLLGGNIVPKDHPRLEAYGTLDELNSWIGLIRDQLIDEDMRGTLLKNFSKTPSTTGPNSFSARFYIRSNPLLFASSCRLINNHKH